MAFTLRQQGREDKNTCPAMGRWELTMQPTGVEGKVFFLGPDLGSVGESHTEDFLHPPEGFT